MEKGFLNRLFTRFKGGSSVSSLQEWHNLATFLGIDETDKESMSEATFYACIRELREAIGKMPLKVMQRTADGGIETARNHPLYRTLNVRPNPYMTATSFWSCVEQNVNYFGNAYVYMTGAGTHADPKQLWIIPFEEMDVWYDDKKILSDVPDIYYRWTHAGQQYILNSNEVLHFRVSDSFDGIMGVPVLDRLKTTVEGNINAQNFQNKLITSGMTAKAVLQYTGSLDEEGARKFAANIEKYAKGEFAQQGVRNIIPLPLGTQLQPLNIKLTDAQFIDLKKYSALQIASAFGIKPQQINDLEKSSYASAEAQQLAFYIDTLLYKIKNYEDEITYKCLSFADQDKGIFAKFNTSVILRADAKTQMETLKMGVEAGIYKPNEARSKLDLPADPAGNRLLGNGNLIPLELAGTQYTGKAQEGGEE